MSGKSFMNDGGESYCGVVSTKLPNKGGASPAEAVEKRPQTKENRQQPNLGRTQSRESRPSGLERVREVARKDGEREFNNVARVAECQHEELNQRTRERCGVRSLTTLRLGLNYIARPYMPAIFSAPNPSRPEPLVIQPHLRCEHSSRPVRRIRRFGLGRSRDDFTNQLRRNSRCAAWARRIFLEAFQARIQEPLPPASSFGRRDRKLRPDLCRAFLSPPTTRSAHAPPALPEPIDHATIVPTAGFAQASNTTGRATRIEAPLIV
jgi:hypothetical protein